MVKIRFTDINNDFINLFNEKLYYNDLDHLLFDFPFVFVNAISLSSFLHSEVIVVIGFQFLKKDLYDHIINCHIMALNFNQYATEANTFLKDYARELNMEDNPEKAGRILMATLHGLRYMISVEESLQFISQLPMFLKAAYVNGWSIKRDRRKIRNMEDFIFLVRSFDGVTSVYDFESDEVAEEYINATFLMLRKYVSTGEMDDLKDALPKNLKQMLYDGIFF